MNTTVEALQVKDMNEQKIVRIAAALEDALNTAYNLLEKLEKENTEESFIKSQYEVNEMEQIIDKLETAGFAFKIAVELGASELTGRDVHERTLNMLKREVEEIKYPKELYLGFGREKLTMNRKLALLAVLTK